ncbi:MAG: hypothetical protein IK142_09140 [Clostridiales bacterium]|nr:hypothetical protein [Clostridiales bacterium]
MQEDFHYYATYCAAYLAGYTHDESMDICYSAQFVDLCTKTLLSKLGAPQDAATTQLQLELADSRTDILGLQDITRIWASFHFLPYDLYAQLSRKGRGYMNRYRLICKPNGPLLERTVNIANGTSLQHVGIAMHVLADTWAHTFFAGTPSLVINNTTDDFSEILTAEDGSVTTRRIRFRHNPGAADDLEQNLYTNTVYQSSEKSIMNLGHGRAGHLPDYSFIRYEYLPAWNNYESIVKDNPADYMKAFAQMIYAMKFLRGELDEFKPDTYADDTVAPYKERINEILTKRQINACEDWKKFGEELSGQTIEDFDLNKFQEEYIKADKSAKKDTFIGKFIEGALAQKHMVTAEIVKSGNVLAGIVKFKQLDILKEAGLD